MTRRADLGVTLLFVLALLALTAAIVVAMEVQSDGSITRSQTYADASAAQALIAAGEISAVIALRRDGAVAPEVDHAGEDWAKTGQDEVAIDGGRFSLHIADAQGLFNLNNLATEGVLAQQRLSAIVAALGLPPDLAKRIIAAYGTGHTISHLSDLSRLAAATPSDLTTLAQMVTVLPEVSDVNLNAAAPGLIAVLLQNPKLAAQLETKRAAAGFLTQRDLEGMSVTLPAGLGLRSNFFALRVTVQVAGTVQSTDSLIQRRVGQGPVAAAVIARHSVMAAGSPPPPSP